MGLIERPYCERLGTQFERDFEAPGMISPEAAAHPPVFARARAVARYDGGTARALANRLKYYDRLELAEPMGRWMTRAGAELLRDADLLVPIPLHRLRLASRRFNQSAALARVISRESAVPMETMALERVKPTAPQVGLTRRSAPQISPAPFASTRRGPGESPAAPSCWSTTFSPPAPRPTPPRGRC